jgi:hypothetical protein
MNLFVLDLDHKKAAEYHPDQHVGKLLLENFQTLSTAHREIDGDENVDPIHYRKAHLMHPVTKWVRETADNYMWSFQLAKCLSEEFTYRTGKVHLSWQKLGKVLSKPPKGLTATGLTEQQQCMPEQYKKAGDAVQAYRNYFNGEKQILQKRPAQWKKRDIPYWFNPIKL